MLVNSLKFPSFDTIGRRNVKKYTPSEESEPIIFTARKINRKVLPLPQEVKNKSIWNQVVNFLTPPPDAPKTYEYGHSPADEAIDRMIRD